MGSPQRTMVMLAVIASFGATAHVDAARAGAIIWKKGSGDRGEVMSARELLQCTTKTSVPDYRENQVLLRFTGRGVFDLRINPATGETTGIRILNGTGHSELDGSALKALIDWRFKPGIVRVVFPLSFLHRRNDWPASPGSFLDRAMNGRPH